jgi:hypothetical protein
MVGGLSIEKNRAISQKNLLKKIVRAIGATGGAEQLWWCGYFVKTVGKKRG